MISNLIINPFLEIWSYISFSNYKIFIVSIFLNKLLDFDDVLTNQLFIYCLEYFDERSIDRLIFF